MPRYINTRGNASLAIAVCDRCKFKFPLVELMEDGNSPGLRVCLACRDDYDPYRLPTREPEDVTLQYPRPEEPLV